MGSKTIRKSSGLNNVQLWTITVTIATLLTFGIAFASLPGDEDASMEPHFGTSRDIFSSNSDNYMKSQKKTARYTYFTTDRKLTKQQAKFCLPDEDGDCQYPKYGESVLLAPLFGGFLIAILSMCTGTIFWSFRACCFGGCRPSHGIFCPRGTYADSGENYSKKEVWIIKIFAIVLTVLALIFAIVGFVGTSKVTKSYNDSIFIVRNSTNYILDELQYIVDALRNAPQYNLDISGFPTKEEVNDMIDPAVKIGDQFQTARSAVMITAFVLCLVLFLLTAISGLVNFCYLALIAGIIGFFAMFLMWISFGLHYPLSSMVADTCIEWQAAYDNPNTTGLEKKDPQYWLRSAVDFGNFPLLVEQRENILRAVKEVEDLGCDTIADYCDLKLPCYGERIGGFGGSNSGNCSVSSCSNFNRTSCSRHDIPIYMNYTIGDFIPGCATGFNVTGFPIFTDESCPISDITQCVNGQDAYVCKPIIYLSMQDCAQNCTYDQARDIADTLYTTLRDIEFYSTLLDDRVLPLLSGVFVTENVAKLNRVLCETLIDGLFYIILASAFLGSLFVIGITIAALGTKRFIKAYQDSHDTEMDDKTFF